MSVFDKLPFHLRRGQQGEQLAQRHLREQGLSLLETNYRSRWGEIDLIMQDGEVLVFVEVRLRAASRYGTPAETIGGRKRQRLIRTAQQYLQTHRDARARFDVIAITTSDQAAQIEWIKNAFSA
jgi:putative endonuclease